jgi:hypothetical protein
MAYLDKRTSLISILSCEHGRLRREQLLVCDLQGVFNPDTIPPTFELSDPAVHYSSKRRTMVFGRTDKGKEGMQLFFNSHRCTSICKYMQLSQKNIQWKKEWRDSDMRAMF